MTLPHVFYLFHNTLRKLKPDLPFDHFPLNPLNPKYAHVMLRCYLYSIYLLGSFRMYRHILVPVLLRKGVHTL